MAARFLFSASLSFFLSWVSGSAVMAAPLAPSGKWMVEGQNNMCALSRPFGEGSAKIVLGFRPSPLEHGLEVFLFTHGFGDVQQGIASLKIDGKGTPFSGSYVSYEIANKDERQITFPIDRTFLQALPSAASVTITIGKRLPISLETLDAKKAIAVLDYCQTELRKSLAIDLTKLNDVALPAIPKGSQQTWFTADDYPTMALAGGAQGISRLLLTIDVDGRVSSCVPYGSTGNAEIDRASCAKFKQRGRYAPAKDKTNHPIVSYQETAIHWLIPS